MAEIKPMNLSGVAYNPMNSSAARGDIAKNAMSAERLQMQREQVQNDKNKTQQQILIQKAQLKMQEKMNDYRVKAMDRAEEDYQKTKLAENYMFKNYPKMTSKSMTDFLEDGLTYGIGGYDEARKRWSENVGNHSWQSFEKHYNNHKMAEMKSLQNAMVYDPRSGKTKPEWRQGMQVALQGMDPADRNNFLNSLDGSSRQIFNDTFPHTKSAGDRFSDFITNSDIWMGENPVKTSLGTASAVITTGLLLRKQPGKIISKLWNRGGKVTNDMPDVIKRASLKMGDEGGAGYIAKSDIDKAVKSGAISKNQASILRQGGRVVPEIYKNQPGKISSMMGPEVVNHSNIKYVSKDINKAIKNGQLNQSDGDKLKGIIDDLVKSGDDITGEAIGAKIKAGGSKFNSLKNSMKTGMKSVGYIGGVNTLGILRGAGMLGTAIAGYGVGTDIGESMGYGEQGQALTGLATQTAATGTAGVLGTVTNAVRKHGPKKILQVIAKRGGPAMAARLVGKGFLSGTGLGSVVGAALLASEVALIAYFLREEFQ